MGFKWVPKRKTKSKNKKAKRGLSDKLFIAIAIVTGIFIVFVCVVVWTTKDTSPLAYLIPSIFVEFSVATGFQWRKAERENVEGGKIAAYIKSENEDMGH